MNAKDYRFDCSQCGAKLTLLCSSEKPEKQFCSACGALMTFVSEKQSFGEKEETEIKFELEQNPIEINPKSIGGKLNFPIEEIQEFPKLNETQLPNNIQLKQTKPECTLKDRFCVDYGGKHCCLRLLHEKPEGDRKAIFELFQCEFEGANVEETEGFVVNT